MWCGVAWVVVWCLLMVVLFSSFPVLVKNWWEGGTRWDSYASLDSACLGGGSWSGVVVHDCYDDLVFLCDSRLAP